MQECTKVKLRFQQQKKEGFIIKQMVILDQST